MSHDATPARSDSDSIRTLTDPEALRDRSDVDFDIHTRRRESRDHCGATTAGQAVVGSRNDAGELLLLVHEEEGIALLPHGTVDGGVPASEASGDSSAERSESDVDWAETARTDAAGKTGIEFDLETVERVRRVEHRLEGEEEPHATTHQVVFRATPAGGEIDDCKRSAEAGSDAWTAGWFDGLPDDVEAPEGVSGDDVRLFL